MWHELFQRIVHCCHWIWWVQGNRQAQRGPENVRMIIVMESLFVYHTAEGRGNLEVRLKNNLLFCSRGVLSLCTSIFLGAFISGFPIPQNLTFWTRGYPALRHFPHRWFWQQAVQQTPGGSRSDSFLSICTVRLYQMARFFTKPLMDRNWGN